MDTSMGSQPGVEEMHHTCNNSRTREQGGWEGEWSNKEEAVER
jgi:hypothetical protein